MNKQFIREAMLFGADAVEFLGTRSVIVFGIGGVGSFCAEALVRAGIGSLTFVDNDVVSLSNLNRQLIALHSTIGQYKVEVMAQRAKDINPACQINAIPQIYSAETSSLFFRSTYDYVVDAIDTVSCKLHLIQTAKLKEIPIISALGTGNKCDATLIQVTDISKTTGDGLARVIRKELRSRGIQHHKVVYSPELSASPAALEAPPPGRRSVPASVPWVPSAAGLTMAGTVVQDLLHLGGFQIPVSQC